MAPQESKGDTKLTALFSAPKPPPLPPPPPVIKRTDPRLEGAREKLRLAALKRRGRTASVAFGKTREARLGSPEISRPEASEKLG